ncbi:hypothetical protein [Cupriavidus sp. KK10]|jgi:transposase|uniref:hypothetical protein n=1 Tax=Cupriavidus sp. KK10 TaxID=1478019 RepID=UPI0020132319|nr:hypothetical protein [Cupriavidus sp. KK10]
MKLTAIGMDIVKHIFQLHAVNANSSEIERKLKRQVTEFFTKRERALVALEACGSAHHWARQLQPLSATT